MVTLNLPSAPVVALPIGAPLLSVMVTVLPASALPVTCEPSSETTRPVGAVGAAVSIATVKPVEVPLVPLLLVAVKVKTCWPSGSAVGVNVQCPESSAVVLPIDTPLS